MTHRLMEKCVNALGENVIYYPESQASVAIKGIFNENFEHLDTDSGFQVVSSQPNLGIQKITLESKPAIQDQLVVRGIVYKVVDVQDDGESAYKLLLHRLDVDTANDLYDWVLIDDQNINYYFYGGSSLLAPNSWKINRYNRTDLAVQSAYDENNSSYLTLSQAWTNRTTLEYLT